MIAGIDLSMTSPAICVGSSTEFNKCKAFFYTNKKKFDGKFGNNIYGMMMLPYESEMERFHNISQWVVSILNTFKVTEVCLEGYSMGSTGSRIFNIAENGGILKYNMWSRNIRFITPAPTQVKKHFSGKGNANKQFMFEAFCDKVNGSVDLEQLLNARADSNPISDIVDAYAMMCYGLENL